MINTNNEKLVGMFNMDNLEGMCDYVLTDGSIMKVIYKEGVFIEQYN